MTLPTIGELAPGTRIKIAGCDSEMIVLKDSWVADFYFNPPSLSELPPGTKATHFRNELNIWKPFN